MSDLIIIHHDVIYAGVVQVLATAIISTRALSKASSY